VGPVHTAKRDFKTLASSSKRPLYHHASYPETTKTTIAVGRLFQQQEETISLGSLFPNDGRREEWQLSHNFVESKWTFFNIHDDQELFLERPLLSSQAVEILVYASALAACISSYSRPEGLTRMRVSVCCCLLRSNLWGRIFLTLLLLLLHPLI
jgi:hypothetical protein